MSKETFKVFVRKHPELAESTLNNTTTWQKLYELYEMYGENSSVWNNFFKVDSTSSNNVTSTVGNFLNTIKNVDMDTVQKGIDNIQKTIGLLQDIGIGAGTTATVARPYEPRPLYQHFDD